MLENIIYFQTPVLPYVEAIDFIDAFKIKGKQTVAICKLLLH